MNHQLLYNLTQKVITDTLNNLGYPVFEKGNYNLNFGIVRASNRVADSFDDVMYLLFKKDNTWQLHLFPATADPGLDHLKNPVFPEAIKGGSAILADGYYRNLWQCGYFKGTKALIPRTRVWVYRDMNRDNVLDMDKRTLQNMDAGILVHRSFQGQKAERVGRSSAGCQVTELATDMDMIWDICKIAEGIWGVGTSYAVIDESSLIYKGKINGNRIA
jgi:hypothetical protein